MTTPHNANGHRRRQLRKRVLAEETHCALCGEWLDKTLGIQPGKHGRKCNNKTCTGCLPHPRRAEVDEDIPRAYGGSPYDRNNTSAVHRECNLYKGTMTMAQAKEKLSNTQKRRTTIQTSPGW